MLAAMRILMAASEMAPFTGPGRLGEAVAGLTAALQERGHEVSLILPCYQAIREEKALAAAPTGVSMTIEVGARHLETEILEAHTPGGVQLFLVRRDDFFDRPDLYGSGGKTYEDNAERFTFFSKAAVELARRLIPAPDIIHAHDWPTALIPVFIRHRQLPFKTVLTIHHVARQGDFWGIDFGLTNLPGSWFSPTGIEFYGRVNFLKGGILHADAVTTVSELYARAIRTPESGAGLDAVLREQAGKLRGILNGTDSRNWNPATDTRIAKKYTPASLAGKKNCRDALLKTLGLDPRPRGPVFCIFTRPAAREGLDLLIPLLDRLLADDVRLVILEEGDHSRELDPVARRNPGRLAFRPDNDDLAHTVYAGSDVNLIPSHFEASGLEAMQGIRYGAVPITRATGGLHQILTDYDPTTDSGNAFLFYENTAEALWDTIRRAKRQFADTAAWRRLTRKAMESDFSWASAAAEYEKVYEELAGPASP